MVAWDSRILPLVFPTHVGMNRLYAVLHEGDPLRVHKRGAPSVLSLQLPFAESTDDLQIGRIISTFNDVFLAAPKAIVDQLNDHGTGVEADVTGVNITMTAGTGLTNGGIGKQAGAVSSGIIDSVGYLGGVLAGDSVARISVAFGWQGVFVVLASVSALSALGAGYLLALSTAARTTGRHVP